MRISHPLLCACLLGLVVLCLAAPARSDARPSRCSVVADGWKGEVAGRKIKPTHPAVERRVIVLVNRFRRRHGLRPAEARSGPALRGPRTRRDRQAADGAARALLPEPAASPRTSCARTGGAGRPASCAPGAASASRGTCCCCRGRGASASASASARFKGERVTIATADFSAARPKAAKSKARMRQAEDAVAPRRTAARSPAPALVSAPSTPPAPATPVAVPAPPAPSGPVVGVPYTCNGPVNGVRVVGTGSDSRALVDLGAGCTGTLSFDIHVTSGGRRRRQGAGRRRTTSRSARAGSSATA